MNSNAPISGQVASQPSSQMPGLPQRINNSMASQMQNLDSRKMDPEFMQLRRKMQQKIYNTLQKKNQSNDWLRKLPEIVRHLEECMFRDNATKDEYLTLYMESNENHFFSIIKSIISSKHRAPHQVRASSTPSMMIPTPGMQQDRSTQSIVSGSVENPKMGGPSVECPPSTNMGNLQPTGNGLTDVNTPFNLANVSNGQQRQGTNFPLGSVVRNVMHSNSAGVPRQSSQMIPTPGYIDPQAVSLASGSSNATNLSSDESTVPLELQQKRNIGNPSNHLLHSLGGQIDSGIRPSTLQKALLHSMSNGVVNGGLDSVGSNMQFKRSTNLEGLLKTGPPNVPPKPLQQHFDQQIHQPRMPDIFCFFMLSSYK
ncbi:probable histone acetyltransferase HAC-like 1 [Zingiber officinale]|uniref:probable histone acetyltransferase HAC-like 1 n=1 Tax=Zingiber officinale TaxID=94328 RepID=UPI001C4D4ACE|nr:probable histone acetyltransferase HAC-like 1 [Zingiber officinale]